MFASQHACFGAIAVGQLGALASSSRCDSFTLKASSKGLSRRWLKPHALAPRQDRWQHCGCRVSDEDHVSVSWWFLKRLEEGVGRRLVHPVGSFDHEHSALRFKWSQWNCCDDLTDVVNEDLPVCSFWLDPHQVGVSPSLDSRCGVVAIGPSGEQGRGHSFCDFSPPAAWRPVEQPSVSRVGGAVNDRAEHSLSMGVGGECFQRGRRIGREAGIMFPT